MREEASEQAEDEGGKLHWRNRTTSKVAVAFRQSHGGCPVHMSALFSGHINVLSPSLKIVF